MTASATPAREPSRDRALARYVRREVYPYSALNRQRLDASNLGPRAVKSMADLAALPAVSLSDVGDGSAAVLRPARESIIHLGRAGLAARIIWSAGWGRHDRFLRRVLEPRYRPVRWLLSAATPIGVAARDLDRLGRLGAGVLAAAGLRRGDAIVAVGLSGHELAAVELERGAVAAGMAFLPVDAGEPAGLARLDPVALAGPAATLREVLAGGGAGPSLRTLLVTDGPLVGPARDRLRHFRDHPLDVRVVWAPDGVRSLWFECADDRGLHTSPDADRVEVGETGQVVWSPVGWAGTVVLRLATGLRGRVDRGPCPSCGRNGDRVVPDPVRPARTARRTRPVRAVRADRSTAAPRGATGRRTRG